MQLQLCIYIYFSDIVKVNLNDQLSINNIGLATKWLRILSLSGIDKILLLRAVQSFFFFTKHTFAINIW